jgi:hypothetical protein
MYVVFNIDHKPPPLNLVCSVIADKIKLHTTGYQCKINNKGLMKTNAVVV